MLETTSGASLEAKSNSVEREFVVEESSSSGGSTDGYVTPDEFLEDQKTQSRCPDEDIQDALRDADELKVEATEYFHRSQWTEALQTYKRALARLPRRKTLDDLNDKGKSKADVTEEVPEINTNDGSVTAVRSLEEECAKARAVLNGNIGACHVKLGEHKESVAACSEALLDDAHYVKALHRRATSNDAIGTWGSLAAAEEDYKRLLEILPATSPLLGQVRQAFKGVKPRREAAQKEEMGEMVDKLKGLGNSLLGNFGLSTDNFKFEPNGQGGLKLLQAANSIGAEKLPLLAISPSLGWAGYAADRDDPIVFEPTKAAKVRK